MFRRPLLPLLALALFACEQSRPPMDGYAQVEGAVTCNAKLKAYPVHGPHNGGWDPNALTYSCPDHPSNAKDNSDWIAGDHYGNDIFAAKGTLMVSPVDGTVVSKSTTDIGGNNVTVRDACGWYYYHAHLDKFAAGLTQGQSIKAGDPIGTVGNTGNASGTSPHLHFSIYPGTYTSGIDPFPLLQQVDHTACTDSPGPQPTLPKMAIWSATAAKDTRPEGNSAGIGDVYEGDTFNVDIFVEAKKEGANTSDSVQIGYSLEDTWLKPVTYTIHTDWPAKDKKTWKLNDADSAPGNPSKTNPPAQGKINIYAMGAGETKRIRFTVKAKKYSLGAVDHPDVRAWVWHVGDYYGEQTSWNDAVETNNAGTKLRTYQQHDVYGKRHWEWNAGHAAETEGWSAGNKVSPLKVNTTANALAIGQETGDSYIYSPKTTIDANTYRGFRMRMRQYSGEQQGQLFFTTSADSSWNEAKSVTFWSPGDGELFDVEINGQGNPKWAGTITQLRLDPTTDADGWFDVDWLRAIKTPGPTTGPADGGGGDGGGVDGDQGDCESLPGVGKPCTVGVGHCAASGTVVCDGETPICSAQPGQAMAEACDGLDNDCDGEVDEGFPIGEACEGAPGCTKEGIWECSLDGKGIACNAASGDVSAELCNGVDDDCDGQTDEDFGVMLACERMVGGCSTTGFLTCTANGDVYCKTPDPVGDLERCDAVDNDCDGEVDEGFPVGQACQSPECPTAPARWECDSTGLEVLCVAACDETEPISVEGPDGITPPERYIDGASQAAASDGCQAGTSPVRGGWLLLLVIGWLWMRRPGALQSVG